MFTSNSLDNYFGELSEQMWTLLPVDRDFATRLLATAQASPFRPAGIGSSATIKAALRSDSIRWLDTPQNQTETEILQHLNDLQTGLQNYFRLYLQKFECHFSVYEPGQHYARHSDTQTRSADGTSRIFSFVIYLNPEWTGADGGELRGYDGTKTLFEILPQLGTMILFKSELEHEVLAARKNRYALTGWFRK